MILNGYTGKNRNLHPSPFSRLRLKFPQAVRSRWIWMSKRRRNKSKDRSWKSQAKSRRLASSRNNNRLNYHRSPDSRTYPNRLRLKNRLPRSDHQYHSPHKANLYRIRYHSCSNHCGRRSLSRTHKRVIYHHRMSTGNHLCHLNHLLLRLAILRINYLPHHPFHQGPAPVHLGLRHQPFRVPMAQLRPAPLSQPLLFLLQLRKEPLNRVLLLHTPKLLLNSPLNPHLAFNNGR